jgi:hypothetical protein
VSSGAHEQQVGYVRAGDQQDESDRADQHAQGQAHVSYECLLKGLDAEACALVEVREFPAKILRRDLEARLGLLESHAGLEAASGLEIVALVGRARIELEGDPDVGRRAELLDVEALADHADHDVGIPTQGDGPACHLRIAAEAAGPQVVVDQGHARTLGRVLLRGERAAQDNGSAEAAEVVAGDLGGAKLFRLIAARIVDDAGAKGRDLLQHTRLLAPVLEFRGGRCVSRALRRCIHEHHQAFGIGERDRLEEHRVNKGENGRIGPDSKRQSGHRGDGEAGTPQEAAEGMLHVSNKGVHCKV